MLSGISNRIDPNVIINKANQRFNRVDSNQDGQLTKLEIASTIGRNNEARVEHFYDKFDSDGDGTITQSEFETVVQESAQRVLNNQSGAGSGGRPAPGNNVKAQLQVQSAIIENLATDRGGKQTDAASAYKEAARSLVR